MSRNCFRAFFNIPFCWLQNVHFWDRRKNVDISRFRYGIFVLGKKCWSCKFTEAFAWSFFCSVHFLNHSPRIDTWLEGLTSEGINTLCICFWSPTFSFRIFHAIRESLISPNCHSEVPPILLFVATNAAFFWSLDFSETFIARRGLLQFWIKLVLWPFALLSGGIFVVNRCRCIQTRIASTS